MQEDRLLKVVDKEKHIRIFLATTQNLVEEVRTRHNTSATASAALGRVLTAALLMGSDMKGEKDALTLRINGNGLAGTILATADSKGHVRGFISNPSADLPSKSPGKLAVGELVGKDGNLEVIKDLGLKQPFIGTVALENGEIAEDLTRYFMDSEQIPSLVSLGVLVAPDLTIQAAGGLIVQALPGADDHVLEILENNIFQMGSISNMMESVICLEDVVKRIMEGLDYSIIGEENLSFQCICSQERLGGILAGLSQEELDETYSEQDEIEVTCNFCNEVYHIHRANIEEIRRKNTIKP
ncbi:MAG: Hsp33 family molecular chaperone HslO [Bacillota bacterium]|nr:Hsp33 family molecular chaperone HslO [Bacillota bacterium]